MGVTCPSGHSSSSISYFVRRSSEEIPKGRFKLPWESITTVNQYQRGNPAVLHVSRVMHVPDTVIKIIRYQPPNYNKFLGGLQSHQQGKFTIKSADYRQSQELQRGWGGSRKSARAGELPALKIESS